MNSSESSPVYVPCDDKEESISQGSDLVCSSEHFTSNEGSKVTDTSQTKDDDTEDGRWNKSMIIIYRSGRKCIQYSCQYSGVSFCISKYIHPVGTVDITSDLPIIGLVISIGIIILKYICPVGTVDITSDLPIIGSVISIGHYYTKIYMSCWNCRYY